MMRTIQWMTAMLLAGLAACGGQSGSASSDSIALVNPDFEAVPAADGSIPGWSATQHAEDNVGDVSYKFEIDRNVHAAGAASFRIERIKEQVYGMISQNVPISAQAGHTIELTAQMKTRDVGPDGWELMLTFTDGGSNPRRSAKPLTGTQDFHQVAIRAQVPPGAQEVEIAAVLNDRGTAWLDDVHLRVVD